MPDDDTILIPDDEPTTDEPQPVEAEPVKPVTCGKCGGNKLDPTLSLEPGIKASSLDGDIADADQEINRVNAGCGGDRNDAETRLRSLHHLRDCGNPVTE